MANKIIQEKLVDSNKRALVKYVYISDATAESNTIILDASSLALALNANSYIMQSNTHPKSVYKVGVKRVFGSAKVANTVSLAWSSNANTEFLTIQTGSFDYSFAGAGTGGGVMTNPLAAGATGDIALNVRSPAFGDSFTIFLELTKSGDDYDQGQTADPIAFNRER